MIIASILAAFGIEAGWDARGERMRRDALMDDLRTELVRNRDDLSTTLVAQRLREERINLLLGELTSPPAGLAANSVRALQVSLIGLSSYDPSLGILELLIQSGDLALIEDRELRARLAGLSSVSEDYLANQYLLVQTFFTPEWILGTGSIFLDMSDIVEGDTLLTTASPSVRTTSARFLAIDRMMTELMIGQGEELRNEVEALIKMIQRR